jgi:hypothetical protein
MNPSGKTAAESLESLIGTTRMGPLSVTVAAGLSGQQSWKNRQTGQMRFAQGKISFLY